MQEEGESHSETKQFVASKGLSSAEAQELLLKYGRNELEDKKKPKVSSFLLRYKFRIANQIELLDSG